MQPTSEAAGRLSGPPRSALVYTTNMSRDISPLSRPLQLRLKVVPLLLPTCLYGFARKEPTRSVRHVINSTNNLKNMVQVQRLEMSRDDFVVGALNHGDVGSQFRRRGRCIIMT